MVRNNRIKLATILINSKRHSLYKGINTIGRHPSAVVILREASASHQHAIITIIDQDTHYISDLKSCNRTIVNDVPLIPFNLYTLYDNDKIRFSPNIEAVYKKNCIILEESQQFGASQLESQAFIGNTQLCNEDTLARSTNAVINLSAIPDDDELDRSMSDFVVPDNIATQKMSISIHDMATQLNDIGNIHLLETQTVPNNYIDSFAGVLPQNQSIHDIETQPSFLSNNDKINIEKTTNGKSSEKERYSQENANLKVDEFTGIHNMPTQKFDSGSTILNRFIPPVPTEPSTSGLRNTRKDIDREIESQTDLQMRDIETQKLRSPPEDDENTYEDFRTITGILQKAFEDINEKTEYEVQAQKDQSNSTSQMPNEPSQFEYPPFIAPKRKNPLDSDEDSDGSADAIKEPPINNFNDENIASQNDVPRFIPPNRKNPLDSDEEDFEQMAVINTSVADDNNEDGSVLDERHLGQIVDINSSVADDGNENERNESIQSGHDSSRIISPINKARLGSDDTTQLDEIDFQINETVATDAEEPANKEKEPHTGDDFVISDSDKEKQVETSLGIVKDNFDSTDIDDLSASKSSKTRKFVKKRSVTKSRYIMSDSDDDELMISCTQKSDCGDSLLKENSICNNTDNDSDASSASTDYGNDSCMAARSMINTTDDFIPATQEASLHLTSRLRVDSSSDVSFKLSLSEVPEESSKIVEQEGICEANVVQEIVSLPSCSYKKDGKDENSVLETCGLTAVNITLDRDEDTQKDDVFLVPTQQMSDYDVSVHDEIFLFATQKVCEPDTGKSSKIIQERGISTTNSEDEEIMKSPRSCTNEKDMFFGATQEVYGNKGTILGACRSTVLDTELNRDEDTQKDDLFLIPTQRIPPEHDDNFSVATQKISEADTEELSQAYFPSINDDTQSLDASLEIPQNTNQPKLNDNNLELGLKKNQGTIMDDSPEATNKPMNQEDLEVHLKSNFQNQIICDLDTQLLEPIITETSNENDRSWKNSKSNAYKTTSASTSSGFSEFESPTNINKQDISSLKNRNEKLSNIESQLEVMFDTQNVSMGPLDNSRPLNPLASVLETSTQDVSEAINVMEAKRKKLDEEMEENISKQLLQNKKGKRSTSKTPKKISESKKAKSIKSHATGIKADILSAQTQVLSEDDIEHRKNDELQINSKTTDITDFSKTINVMKSRSLNSDDDQDNEIEENLLKRTLRNKKGKRSTSKTPKKVSTGITEDVLLAESQVLPEDDIENHKNDELQSNSKTTDKFEVPKAINVIKSRRLNSDDDQNEEIVENLPKRKLLKEKGKRSTSKTPKKVSESKKANSIKSNATGTKEDIISAQTQVLSEDNIELQSNSKTTDKSDVPEAINVIKFRRLDQDEEIEENLPKRKLRNEKGKRSTSKTPNKVSSKVSKTGNSIKNNAAEIKEDILLAQTQVLSEDNLEEKKNEELDGINSNTSIVVLLERINKPSASNSASKRTNVKIVASSNSAKKSKRTKSKEEEEEIPKRVTRNSRNTSSATSLQKDQKVIDVPLEESKNVAQTTKPKSKLATKKKLQIDSESDEDENLSAEEVYAKVTAKIAESKVQKESKPSCSSRPKRKILDEDTLNELSLNVDILTPPEKVQKRVRGRPRKTSMDSVESVSKKSARSSKKPSRSKRTLNDDLNLHYDQDEAFSLTVPRKQVTFSFVDDASSSVLANETTSGSENDQKNSKPRVNVSTSKCESKRMTSKPKVTFTMLDSPKLRSLVKSLKGTVVDAIEKSTVLVTERIQRTPKLFAAIARGIPVCPPEWLYQCEKSNAFVDPWDHLLKDPEAEKQWQFSIETSYERSKNAKLFAGYSFQLLTTHAVDTLRGVIEVCGGKILSRQPSSSGNFIAVAEKEQNRRMSNNKADVKVVLPEAIYLGALRQQLLFDDYLMK